MEVHIILGSECLGGLEDLEGQGGFRISKYNVWKVREVHMVWHDLE